MLKDQCATSEMLQGNRLLICKYSNGHKWKLGWEADQNHQLAWNFDSLPRTPLPKNKNKIPFYPFSQGRQKDRGAIQIWQAWIYRASFVKDMFEEVRDKTRHLLHMVQITQQKVQNTLQKPTQAIFV